MKNVPVAKPDDQHADLTEPPDIRHDSWVHLEVDHILKKKSNATWGKQMCKTLRKLQNIWIEIGQVVD